MHDEPAKIENHLLHERLHGRNVDDLEGTRINLERLWIHMLT